MQIADTVVVVLNPGAGDGIQAIKAGIMEVADIFVINKSDLPGAERMKGDIEMMLNLSCGKTWRPPVVLTSVTDNKGLELLYDKIEAHQAYLLESGQRDQQRKERLHQEVWRLWEDKALDAFEIMWEATSGKLVNIDQEDPYEVAQRLWQERFKGG
jgi:LAO/AO transport system kinase